MKAINATGARVASNCEPEGELSSGSVAEDSYSIRVSVGAWDAGGETRDWRLETGDLHSDEER